MRTLAMLAVLSLVAALAVWAWRAVHASRDRRTARAARVALHTQALLENVAFDVQAAQCRREWERQRAWSPSLGRTSKRAA